ncbi:O-methyltransferase [Pollutimonas bauzanensis]|uniref:Methyltransferase domain-containing protein n=1 Tax=Pollutimonas bauzanensis TaxID=658167 RepID=A0A1M5QJM4_9BURK|nr:class I SAM-dependent methyltransferase [Pollutimonas bauzanensis]SHH14178.1 Methyltransferase domain-containing protein [Pollutimonas bauzanensis]
MDSLSTGRVADVLARLHRDAEAADRQLIEAYSSQGATQEQMIGQILEQEAKDLKALYGGLAGNFLNVTPEFGRFCYIAARACKATHIVEFGTSMGISTIYLAAALRDNGGGTLIGTELEPAKAARARENLEAAGLDDLAEVRVGDARETLKQVDGGLDLVLLDGAFSLYLDVLKLLEPRLKTGALIVGENAFEQASGYIQYVRDPRNGYLSQPMAQDPGRGNELTVVTR